MLGGGESQVPACRPASQGDLGAVNGEEGIGEDGGEEGNDVGCLARVGVGGCFRVV
jgi:hypothetical protein